MLRSVALLLWLGVLAALAPHVEAREVFVCKKDGITSVSTAPEPGSKCQAKSFTDGPKAPSIWAEAGLKTGTLYERVQDGKVIYGTRNLPGSRPIMSFSVKPLPQPSAEGITHRLARPRLGIFDKEFKAASKKHGVDEAFLRAVAQTESSFNPLAVSPKGAMGVMQLMPDTASLYAVDQPFSPTQSINAGARHLAYLLRLYKGDRDLAAAAYNAGSAAVKQHGGIPPYRETRNYVQQVRLLTVAYGSLISSKSRK